MSTARHLPRGRAWLRTLVLLLALLVPGAHAEVHATPVAAAETVGYDALDAALRPPAEAVRRTVAVLRPAPRPIPAPAPATPAGRPRQAPPRPPHALPALRTVVLRC
ncbi:hypothetical protein OG895_18870 [Streptomyces sp. NBC_00201]|uniref:hypothetical protein n=1 Tax=unclassified Streptomyces TaxID=2593676 RepID=UPI00225952E3|nr:MULTISPECIES: hypothetical protein [unclassified Streptomyces]MCX5055898.1 hypothetical protein [Streptomyces sp. NBC_00452]MCX5247246.1 hypothetical protein [Streptomyces sp. NBC_00201]MCX5286992.1 hypothetical protein [Streptomyces sp. NBC_00183]